MEAAYKFADSLDEVIKDEAYLSEQIFNVDETGLFCKQMSAHTYIHKEVKSIPGFKSYKERMTTAL